MKRIFDFNRDIIRANEPMRWADSGPEEEEDIDKGVSK